MLLAKPQATCPAAAAFQSLIPQSLIPLQGPPIALRPRRRVDRAPQTRSSRHSLRLRNHVPCRLASCRVWSFTNATVSGKVRPALQVLDHFAITDGLPGGLAQGARAGEQPRTSSTRPAANIASTRRSMRAASSVPRRVEHEDAALAGRPPHGELPLQAADGLAGLLEDLDRPDQSPRVVGVQAAGGLRVHLGQPAVQPGAAVIAGLLVQAGAAAPNRPVGLEKSPATGPSSKAASRPRTTPPAAGCECRPPPGPPPRGTAPCCTPLRAAACPAGGAARRHARRPSAWPCRCPCPRYSAIESMEMISAPIRRASSTPTAVLPAAVGPVRNQPSVAKSTGSRVKVASRGFTPRLPTVITRHHRPVRVEQQLVRISRVAIGQADDRKVG